MASPALLYKRGDCIFREGDPSNAMYIVKSGRIAIQRSNSSFLAYIGPDEFFGEMGFFDGHPRSATAYAERDSVIWELTHDTLAEQIKHLPVWITKFFRILSERIRQANEHVYRHATSNTMTRFLDLISLMMNNATDPGHLSVTEIAQAAAKLLLISSDILSELFQELSAQKLLEVTGDTIKIPDRQRFVHYTEYKGLEQVLREQLSNESRYSRYPAYIINLARWLNTRVTNNHLVRFDDQFLITADSIRTWRTQQDKTVPSDVIVSAVNLELLYQSDDEYELILNQNELESIVLFSEVQEHMRWLQATEMDALIKYLTGFTSAKCIPILYFNQKYQEIFHHAPEPLEIAALLRISMITIDTQNQVLIPNLKNIEKLQTYRNLHIQFH